MCSVMYSHREGTLSLSIRHFWISNVYTLMISKTHGRVNKRLSHNRTTGFSKRVYWTRKLTFQHSEGFFANAFGGFVETADYRRHVNTGHAQELVSQRAQFLYDGSVLFEKSILFVWRTRVKAGISAKSGALGKKRRLRDSRALVPRTGVRRRGGIVCF